MTVGISLWLGNCIVAESGKYLNGVFLYVFRESQYETKVSHIGVCQVAINGNVSW